jgi:hypothetical protein
MLVDRLSKPLQEQGAIATSSCEEGAEEALLAKMQFDLVIAWVNYSNDRVLNLANKIAPIGDLNLLLISPMGGYDEPNNITNSIATLGKDNVGINYFGDHFNEDSYIEAALRLLKVPRIPKRVDEEISILKKIGHCVLSSSSESLPQSITEYADFLDKKQNSHIANSLRSFVENDLPRATYVCLQILITQLCAEVSYLADGTGTLGGGQKSKFYKENKMSLLNAELEAIRDEHQENWVKSLNLPDNFFIDNGIQFADVLEINKTSQRHLDWHACTTYLNSTGKELIPSHTILRISSSVASKNGLSNDLISEFMDSLPPQASKIALPISDENIDTVVNHPNFSQIKELIIDASESDRNNPISDKTILALSRSLNKLSNLSIHRSTNITDTGLEILRSSVAFSDLKTLEISPCDLSKIQLFLMLGLNEKGKTSLQQPIYARSIEKIKILSGDHELSLDEAPDLFRFRKAVLPKLKQVNLKKIGEIRGYLRQRELEKLKEK